ncbi:MAG: hypothetical protein KGJ07_05300 [Patescibacteria group bacterium]|nr:hypothetical protein [Patescibacteria group bacterium]
MSSTINQTVTQAITPITPNFDIAVINTLKTRVKIAPNFSEFSGTPAAEQPTPTLIITPVASPTAVPTFAFEQVTPTATPGGSTK